MLLLLTKKIKIIQMMGGVDWIHLTQDKDQWWALVNTVMSVQVQ
jgi:hypothetical protein